MCIAIECSYKLDQKNEFKFLCELCTFSQIRSHMYNILLQENTEPLTHAIFTVNANTAYTTVKSVDLICNGDSITASADKEITKPAEELPQ